MFDIQIRLVIFRFGYQFLKMRHVCLVRFILINIDKLRTRLLKKNVD